MNSQSSYPWNFFRSYAKYHLILLVITLGLCIIIYRTHVVFWLEGHKKNEMESALKAKAALLEKIPRSSWCSILNAGQFHYSLPSLQCPNQIFKPAEEDLSSSIKFQGEVFTAYFPLIKAKEEIAPIDKALAIIFGPLLLLFVGVYTLVGVQLARPLKRVLFRLSRIEDQLPYEQKLGLFYKHDEWSKIEAIIKKTELDIEEQGKKLQDEGIKTHTLLESIADEIIAIDLFENSIFYNKNFATNFTNEKEIGASLKLWKIFPDGVVSTHFKSVINNGVAKKIKALHLEQQADQPRYYDLAISPLFDVNKKIIGAVGAFHDVTEAKLTEQMRVDFVANVSHEMRTPLTSIKGFAQLLPSMGLPPNLKPYLDKIVFNTDRLIGLFNDLLNLSVIESQNEIILEATSLKEMLREIRDSLSPIYKEKELIVETDLQVDLIYVDKKLFEQALINLIDNACKYTFTHTKIKVTSFADKNSTIISISDNGPGISKEHLGRIFERFYRVDSSRSMAKGTGLGLSIVKHIINKHKGKVWAESELEQGTSFFIEVPQNQK